MTVELTELRALLAVEGHGTVAAAAEALDYTPSAISQQVKRLERRLGTPMLERVGRGVVLTRQGRFVADEGRRLLADLDGLAARLDAHRDALAGTARLAAFSTAIRGLVAPVVADLADTHPEVELTVLERDPADAITAVVGGQVDLAVVHNWVGVPLHWPRELRSRQIGHDRADLLVHRDDPLATRSVVTPADLLDRVWTSTEPGTICHAWFVQMFAGYPGTGTVRYWSWEFQSQIALVAHGLAVALVPRLGRGQLPEQVVAVPVQEPTPTRELHAVWRPALDTSPLVHHLVDRLIALAGH